MRCDRPMAQQAGYKLGHRHIQASLRIVQSLLPPSLPPIVRQCCHSHAGFAVRTRVYNPLTYNHLLICQGNALGLGRVCIGRPSRPCSTVIAASSNSTSSAAGGSGVASSWPPALEDWLRSHGGTVNGVELRTYLFPSGATDRRLVAATDHPAGALLISVPRHLQIRYDNVEEAAAVCTTTGAAAADPAVSTAAITATATDPWAISPTDATALVALYDKMPRGSDTGAAAWQFKQALTLLYHLSRGSASPLLPYIAHLPGLAPGVPTPRVAMLMADGAVEELQYSIAVQDIQNQKYWLQHVSREVLGGCVRQEDKEKREKEKGEGGGGGRTQGMMDPFGGLAVDEPLFGWAVAVAMSRCFGLSRFRTHTLVPLVDMANHVVPLVDMANHVAPRAASNCEMRSGPEGEVTMLAKRQISAGEELTLTYGSHDNHNLMLSYGFSLQPNPYDTFYLDVDLDTVRNLVEGVGPEGGLAAWQLQLLADKCGLREGQQGPEGGQQGVEGAERGEGGSGAEEESSGSGSGSPTSSSPTSPSIRVYLSARLPSAAAPPGGGGSSSSSSDTSSSSNSSSTDGGGLLSAGSSQLPSTAAAAAAGDHSAVRQPVDPRLMAALRIATLDDEAWLRVLSPLPADKIGAWQNLLARQQEISLMRLLAALVAALYTTFPTTIQQDTQLLAAVTRDVSAAAAAANLTSGLEAAAASGGGNGTGNTAHPAAATPTPTSAAAAAAAAAARAAGPPTPRPGQWPLRPHGDIIPAANPSVPSSPSPSSSASYTRDLAEAVRFRLGLKRTLEGCLQALVGRAKELDGLQRVR